MVWNPGNTLFTRLRVLMKRRLLAWRDPDTSDCDGRATIHFHYWWAALIRWHASWRRWFSPHFKSRFFLLQVLLLWTKMDRYKHSFQSIIVNKQHTEDQSRLILFQMRREVLGGGDQREVQSRCVSVIWTEGLMQQKTAGNSANGCFSSQTSFLSHNKLQLKLDARRRGLGVYIWLGADQMASL